MEHTKLMKELRDEMVYTIRALQKNGRPASTETVQMLALLQICCVLDDIDSRLMNIQAR